MYQIMVEEGLFWGPDNTEQLSRKFSFLITCTRKIKSSKNKQQKKVQQNPHRVGWLWVSIQLTFTEYILIVQNVCYIYIQSDKLTNPSPSLVSFYDKVNEIQSLCFKNSMVLTVALTLYLQLQIFCLKCEFVSLTHFFLSLPSMLCCLVCVFDFCSFSNAFPHLLQQQPKYKSNLSVQNTTTHKD